MPMPEQADVALLGFLLFISQGCARDLLGRDRDETRDADVRDRDETETLDILSETKPRRDPRRN